MSGSNTMMLRSITHEVRACIHAEGEAYISVRDVKDAIADVKVKKEALKQKWDGYVLTTLHQTRLTKNKA
jgi:hypothetical protein